MNAISTLPELQLELQVAYEHPHNPCEDQFQTWLLHSIRQLSYLTAQQPAENIQFLKTKQFFNTIKPLSPQKLLAPEHLSLQPLPLEVCIRLVDADEMQQLNHQFRDIAKPTNVLAFPFEAPPGWQADVQVLGDVVICSSVVADEAEEQRKPVQAHWAHITLHGFLHLLGYDHIDDDDADIMESIETQLLATMNIANPYQPHQTTTVVATNP